MNSRPTVYETQALASVSAGLGGGEARARALEALTQLAGGRHELAAALVTELAVAGDVGARAALAELAAGRWSKAIDFLAERASAVTSGEFAPTGSA